MHSHTDFVDDCAERLSDNVPVCVEFHQLIGRPAVRLYSSVLSYIGGGIHTRSFVMAARRPEGDVRAALMGIKVEPKPVVAALYEPAIRLAEVPGTG